MHSQRRDSRDFLIGLLREANIVEEIIEDVVEACELAQYSAFSLASQSVTVPMLAEKLYLTQDEAESLKEVTLQRLCGVESKNTDSLTSSMEAVPSSNKLLTKTKISVELLSSTSCHARHKSQKSFISLSSLVDESNEKRILESGSVCGSVLSRGQWTDCTADRDSTDESVAAKTSRHDIFDLTEEKLEEFEMSLCDEKLEMAKLADIHLDHAERPPPRPYIPPLLLKDAGLSFEPPPLTTAQSSVSSLDTVSFPLVSDFSLSPVPKYSANTNEKVASKPDNKTREEKLQREEVKDKILSKGNFKKAKQTTVTTRTKASLPSYQRQTISSQAKRKDNSFRKEQKDISCSSSGCTFYKANNLSPKLGKPTRAALARMEFIKRRLQSTSVECTTISSGKKSCSTKVKENVKPNKLVSRSIPLVAS